MLRFERNPSFFVSNVRTFFIFTLLPAAPAPRVPKGGTLTQDGVDVIFKQPSDQFDPSKHQWPVTTNCGKRNRAFKFIL